jgi:non-homologous end joining protein Ku
MKLLENGPNAARHLKLFLVTRPVALYSAVSKSERPRFHRIIGSEMRQLVLHIVDRMPGRFDPAKIVGRCKKALEELIASKASRQPARKEAAKAQVINLLDTPRASVQEKGGKPKNAAASPSSNEIMGRRDVPARGGGTYYTPGCTR